MEFFSIVSNGGGFLSEPLAAARLGFVGYLRLEFICIAVEFERHAHFQRLHTDLENGEFCIKM